MPISATTTGPSMLPDLKTLKDALRIRQRVLMAFEIAEREA